MDNDVEKNKEVSCCFCGRDSSEVKKIIAKLDHTVTNEGEKIHIAICDLCVEKCNHLVKKESTSKNTSQEELEEFTPYSIKIYLDDYIEGQEDAKIAFAVAIYNHYHRIKHHKKNEETILEKSNVMLVGPSGCGKTLMIKIIAKLLKVPFVNIDSSTITAVGYVGQSVEDIFTKVLHAADYNIEMAQQAIIYLDEIDKIAKKDTTGTSKDISGESVQQELLTLLEGGSITVPLNNKRSLQQETVNIDTSNVLFICGGAFPGLNNIIQKRIKGQNYSLDNKIMDIDSLNKKENYEILKYVTNEDFEKYGLIREFINRFPVVITMKELSADEMFELMKNKKNSFIKQYQQIFTDSNIKLEFTDEALKFIVDFAIEQKGGVRSIKRILETILKEDMYDYFSKPINDLLIVDKLMVEKKLSDYIKLNKKNISSFGL